MRTVKNPIIPGFYPDPSIVRQTMAIIWPVPVLKCILGFRSFLARTWWIGNKSAMQ